MRTRRLLGAAAVVCLLAALGCFAEAWRAAGQRQLSPYRAAPTRSATPGTTIQHKPPPQLRPLVPFNAPRPVRVVIPAIGLSARVVPVGLDSAGQMRIPNPTLVGWYRLGPAPGALGPAVLAGHVDTYHGPAVFYRLTGIRRGDKVRVIRADGSRFSFIISKITIVKKTAFPTKAVFDPTNNADIRLITCTGTFDTTTLSYLDSLIAWGHPAPSQRERRQTVRHP
jgi:hypothetical protein